MSDKLKPSIKKGCSNPLAEVFGFPPNNQHEVAKRHRTKRLCPFNNKSPGCTKDKANNPLGVCSISHPECPVITCPIRFREDWIIANDAADFFFDSSTKWTALTEVRLDDHEGKSAGNVDMVLVAHNDNGKILDFGAVEIQAVYISGNARKPFAYYMKNPNENGDMDWTNQPNFPRPDYLSSSRKRLAPQLLFKGGILKSWDKKMAVVLNKSFFETLPKLERVNKNEADIVWLLYDQVLVTSQDCSQRWRLKKVDTIYTKFIQSLQAITTAQPGKIDNFVLRLQKKFNEQFKSDLKKKKK